MTSTNTKKAWFVQYFAVKLLIAEATPFHPFAFLLPSFQPFSLTLSINQTTNSYG